MSDPMMRFDAVGDGMYPRTRELERLDEFIVRGEELDSVHFEAMGEAQFWMVFRLKDGRRFVINCGATNERAKGYCFVEQE